MDDTLAHSHGKPIDFQILGFYLFGVDQSL